MKHIVSISIGSAERDHTAVAEILGETFKLQRIGTGGDFDKAKQLIKEYDGVADAIGLGGIDLYLVAGKRRYKIRDAIPMVKIAKKTPVFDGSGLKNTLEREIIHQLVADGKYIHKGTKVFMLNSCDRFGMAEAVHEAGCEHVFSDFMTGLGLPIPIRSMAVMRTLAAMLLPIFTRVPFKLLYPTGEKQEVRKPQHGKWFRWADVYAGDFLVIRRHMPDDLTGKVIITNTVTPANVEELRTMGLKTLITSTPEFDGRSFGTNVMEGVYAVLLGKKFGERLYDEELLAFIRKMGVKPRIEPLNE